jgi:acyl-CoA reductase-like NAD-dependent aldehyde dehydrogenase
MSYTYKDELADAERQGNAAHDAMEAWVNRPLDAPDVPGEVLEAYAKALRDSRERILRLLQEEGIRDDIEAALARNETYHRSLGLSIRDKPEPEDE